MFKYFKGHLLVDLFLFPFIHMTVSTVMNAFNSRWNGYISNITNVTLNKIILVCNRITAKPNSYELISHYSSLNYFYILNILVNKYGIKFPYKFEYINDSGHYQTALPNVDTTYECNIIFNHHPINILFDRDHVKTHHKLDCMTMNNKSDSDEQPSIILRNNEPKASQIIQEFIDTCSEFSLISSKHSIRMYMNNLKGQWDYTSDIQKRAIETIILSDNMQNVIINDIKSFIDEKKWYETHGFHHKLCILLYGPPGTGKTSMVRAIASHFALDISCMLLSGIENDNQFKNLVMNPISSSESILLIEDIDRYKWETDGNKLGISMPILLNCLDGLLCGKNSIIIITANNPDVLDKAIIRTGRVDRSYYLGYCDVAQVQQIYQMIYESKCPDSVTQRFSRYEKNHYTSSDIINHMINNKKDPSKLFINFKTSSEIIKQNENSYQIEKTN